MNLKQAITQVTSGLGGFKRSLDQATTSTGRIKTAVGQVDPALTKMKGGNDRLSTSLGKLRTSATQGGSGLNQLRTTLTTTDGSLGKAKGGADKLKASLDRLKTSAGGSHAALKEVKSQADAVEKSVGKAGKGADGTGKAMGGLGKGLKGASLAQKGLNLTMMASPFGLVMALLAPLITQFVNMDKVTALLKKGMALAWTGIKSGAASAKEFLVPLIKGLANAYTFLPRSLISMLNGMIGALNGISFTVPDWVPHYGGKHFGVHIPQIPQIPQLAEGGVVQPRAGGRLALLGEAGEAEAVIPLSKLERVLGQGSPAGAAAMHRLAQAVERLAERPVEVRVDSQTIARAVLVGQRQLARR